MALKTGKNLVNSRTEYNACYDGMRGVDFTTDPSQISNNRFSYLVNMFRNYSSEGMSTETIPGFRAVTNGKYEVVSSGYSHGGDLPIKQVSALFRLEDTFFMSQPTEDNDAAYYSVTLSSKEDAAKPWTIVPPTSGTTRASKKNTAIVQVGDDVYIYGDGLLNHICYDKKRGTYTISTVEYFYIPTTYINLPPSGWQQDENNAYGAEYEQRNLLTDEFKVTFIADGESTRYYLPEYIEAKEKATVIIVDKLLTTPDVEVDDTGRSYIVLQDKNKDTETEQEYVPYSKGTKIIVTLSKPIKSVKGASDDEGAKNLVLGCTKACLYDNRVFLTGNPECPNHIFWCGFNAETGLVEPTYFGVLDNMYDGVTSKITGIMAVSDTLVVLKEENSEGTMYFHRPQATGEDLQPKVYPYSRGMSSAGCMGACTNFLDDPVFISRMGLEGIDHMSAGMERIVGHRSSNVDAQLLKHDLTKARLAEWQGYLLMLVDGYLFMADSRQKFQHHTGSVQYEWYYIERLGEWGAWYVYAYADALLEGMSDVNVHSDAGKYVPDNVKVNYNNSGFYYTEEGGVNYLVYPAEKFYPATEIVSTGDNIFFATSRGNLMMFNFDLMDESGELPPKAYSFAGRTIKCGVAFKMDNVGIPHLTKTTVKKSTVIKMKPMYRSRVKVKIRTNRMPYHELNMLSSVRFDFNDIDFSNFAFLDGEQSLFIIYEKEKKWVEKQYYIYSDEFCRPFALYSLAFRYYVAGRYKEK